MNIYINQTKLHLLAHYNFSNNLSTTVIINQYCLNNNPFKLQDVYWFIKSDQACKNQGTQIKEEHVKQKCRS